MSDQAFVKAFSRRRPASGQAGQTGEIALGGPNSEIQTSSETQSHQPTHLQNASSVSKSDGVGGLHLDQSVASTARVWVDQHTEQVSRADYAEDGIPRPHLEPLTGDQTRAFEQRNGDASLSDNRSDIEHVDPAVEERNMAATGESDHFTQHIHNAYASTFTDAASFVNDELSKVAPEEVLRGMRQVDPSSLTSGFTVENELSECDSQLADQHSKSVAGSRSLEPDSAGPELIIENPFAAATGGADKLPDTFDSARGSVSGPHGQQSSTYQPVVNEGFVSQSDPVYPEQTDPQGGLTPFQAVWEVDVLDVPTAVADLFFEGSLFQQIAERMSDAIASGLNSVIVTSAQAGEGRSSVAVGLAMAAAAAGKRVALVDANLEHPKLADELRLELQYGWVDTIRAGLPIKEVAVHAVEDGVTLIPLMPTKGSNTATGYEVVQLVDLLKDKFELIILDGPTSHSSQIHQCASAVDSAIIVRDMTRTDTLAINDFSCRLRESGVQGVGVVENFT
jgi:Mrp family chromosome partitioning ATPase